MITARLNINLEVDDETGAYTTSVEIDSGDLGPDLPPMIQIMGAYAMANDSIRAIYEDSRNS